MSSVLGVVVLARNGDRTAFHQDPETYSPSHTDSTPLGVSDLHLLGTQLRSAYLTPSSASFISSISTNLANTQEVKVLAKAGGEGSAVFDSAIALLQGLFPPNPYNKITLANSSIVMAPLGGYQYIPLETVEPGNDRSLESWTDCPAFQKHISAFHESDTFKRKAKEAQSFFDDIKDFVFGRRATLDNIIYDFMNTQLIYNQTYAYRLPPTYINQARALANFHENRVFSDTHANEIGNIAGRTLLHPLLDAVERIAFSDDPLKLMVVQTTYQPFISFFHQSEIVHDHPELGAIPNFGAALAIELRRGAPPDTRDFLRFKFRNGTDDPDSWRVVHAFGHRADIPLTEFVYRIEVEKINLPTLFNANNTHQGSAITSNKQWRQVCGAPDVLFWMGVILLVGLALFAEIFLKRRRHSNRVAMLERDEEVCDYLLPSVLNFGFLVQQLKKMNN
ncbi:histidine phosphatase superfamily [Mycena haematopus]|nr:histidine phosphatase superfamily [Mycena haematopus]